MSTIATAFAATIVAVPPPAQAVEPGSVTVRLVWNDSFGADELTYSVNATGWSRRREVCIDWVLKYGVFDGDGYGNITRKDSGRKCGTGSVSTATFTRRPDTDKWDVAFLEATATGPGGSDSDHDAVYFS